MSSAAQQLGRRSGWRETAAPFTVWGTRTPEIRATKQAGCSSIPATTKLIHGSAMPWGPLTHCEWRRSNWRRSEKEEERLRARIAELRGLKPTGRGISPIQSRPASTPVDVSQEAPTGDSQQHEGARPRTSGAATRLAEEETTSASSDSRVFANPLVRRFMQTPWVGALDEYKVEEAGWKAEEAARRRRVLRRKRNRYAGRKESTSSGDDDLPPGVPTSVSFKVRIKNFHKFSEPNRNESWPDYVQQLVETLRLYRVPSSEWAGWLVDRLSGKAQGALLNLPIEDRNNWKILLATLNAHFHVEFEMRSAEEELATRKQGSKESVRDFIAQLMALARKAYGNDNRRREAAVLKRLEHGLNSASLRRTYDEVMLYPESDLAILTQELVRRESRDDPAHYKANIVQEKEEANAKKPNHPSTETVVRQVLAVQGEQEKKSDSGKGAEAAAATTSRRRGGPRDRRSKRRDTGGLANVECWHCGIKGHVRTSCRKATAEQIAEWQSASSRRPAKKSEDKTTAQGVNSVVATTPGGNE